MKLQTAKGYIVSRNRSLPSSGPPKSTPLRGITQEQMTNQQRFQEEQEFVYRGLVPVAVDFADLMRRCGVEVERDSVTFGSPHHWVPAWCLAAHRSYGGLNETAVLGVPTEAFKEYMSSLLSDPKEQALLVAEYQLEVGFAGELTVAGFRRWLEINQEVRK